MKRYMLVNKTKLILVIIADILGKPVRWFSRKGLIKSPSKIAVLHLDHIGDVIFAMPAIQAIRGAFPDSQIISIVGEWAEPILFRNPNVNKIIQFNAPWFARDKKTSQLQGIIALKKLLNKLGPDMVIDFRGDLRHNVAMYMAKVPNRVGYGITGGGFLLTHEVEYPFDGHAVLRHMAIPKALGATVDVADIELKIYISKDEKNWVEEFLSKHNLEGRTLIGMHPETGTQAKQWSMSSFVRTMELLAGKLADKNPLFIFTGLKTFGLNSSNVVDLGGKLTLRQLAALQSKLDLFICGDTGPLHMATALGCPTVAIYSGTNDLKIWGPWGNKVRVLQAEVNCAPCGRSSCEDNECMTLITPQMAVNSSLELLDIT